MSYVRPSSSFGRPKCVDGDEARKILTFMDLAKTGGQSDLLVLQDKMTCTSEEVTVFNPTYLYRWYEIVYKLTENKEK